MLHPRPLSEQQVLPFPEGTENRKWLTIEHYGDISARRHWYFAVGDHATPCCGNSGAPFAWVRVVGTPNKDYGRGFAADANGNCYITGSFDGTATFGSTNISSSGGSNRPDIFGCHERGPARHLPGQDRRQCPSERSAAKLFHSRRLHRAHLASGKCGLSGGMHDWLWERHFRQRLNFASRIPSTAPSLLASIRQASRNSTD